MDTRTGKIRMFDDPNKAELAGYTMPVEVRDLHNVLSMNRKQRREWAAKQKRMDRLISKAG